MKAIFPILGQRLQQQFSIFRCSRTSFFLSKFTGEFTKGILILPGISRKNITNPKGSGFTPLKSARFSIFCRNRNIVEGYVVNLKNCKINIHEADLLDLEKNLTLVEKLENDIDGFIWISGFTGNAEKELLSTKEGEENIRIKL